MKRIKEILVTLKNNKVVTGSFVMTAGGLIGSFTNYLYHLVVARTLGPKDYGTLDSLISIVYQLSIFLATLSLVVTKYVSFFKGQDRRKTIESFFWKLCKKLLLLTPLILLFILVSTPIITDFLHLSSPLLFIWIGLSFLINLFSALGRSFLQGLSRFITLAITAVFEGLFRLMATILLLYLGWGLMGAVFPFFAMSILSTVFALYFVRDLIRGEKNEPIHEKKEILKFILPVFLTNVGATSLITSDIILARHYLTATDAGLYSALSTLGKIIYFAAAPITSVIFPIISEAHGAKKNTKSITILGLGIIGFIIVGSFLVFGFFPKLMVTLLFGEKYLTMVPFVIYFAIIMSLYTINTSVLNIFLALRITLPTVFVCIAALSQILLITLFHESISQIINVFILVSSLLFFSLLVFSWRAKKGPLPL